MKLFLWRRLQSAYIAISYTPKVVSCLLRALETVVIELFTKHHASKEHADRQASMLRWLRDADELLIKVLVKVLNEGNALECLDESHIQT